MVRSLVELLTRHSLPLPAADEVKTSSVGESPSSEPVRRARLSSPPVDRIDKVIQINRFFWWGI